MKTKIAIVIPSFFRGKGGAEKVASKVATILVDHQYDVFLCAKRKLDDVSSYEISDSVNIVEYDVLLDDLTKEFASFEIDLFVAFGMAGFFVDIARLSQKTKIPYVIQECSNPIRITKKLFYNCSQVSGCDIKKSILFRNLVHELSSGIRLTVPKYLASIHKNLRYKSFSFYNSLDISMNQRKAFDQRKKKIICVGGLKVANKNGFFAIKSFLDSKAYDKGYSLHFYGDNNFKEQFSTMIQGYENCIVDEGVVHDVGKIYKDARLLIIPSYEEGLPNVVLEAFCYGIPVIGFKQCNGTNYLLEKSDGGVLIEQDDVKQASEKIKYLLIENHWENASKNGFDFAKVEFNKNRFVDNWLSLISFGLKEGLQNKKLHETVLNQIPVKVK